MTALLDNLIQEIPLMDEVLRVQAQELLGRLRAHMERQPDLFCAFPKLEVVHSEDGSVTFYWFFSDCRFAFSLEPEPEESGWYLVSKKSAGIGVRMGTLDEDFGAALALLKPKEKAWMQRIWKLLKHEGTAQ